jgi:hypothetical protein
VCALRKRSKSQPSPARAIYEALSDPVADQARREWLDLRDGELPPRVVRAVFPFIGRLGIPVVRPAR